MHKKAYKEGLTMKKWYRKTVTRTIVLVVAILSGALLVTNLLSLLTLAGGMSLSQIQKMNTQSFEESEEFSKMVESYMYDVQEKLYLQNLFESDGAYNPKKLVDVMELSKKGKISETNLSGVTYTMEELVNWGETYSGTDNDNLYKQNGVIVCQKPDGNYYYYYMNDFFSLVNAGKLQFQMGEQDRDQFLAGLQAGEFTTSGYYTFQITDENGELLYTDCWNFGQSMIEKYAPVGADNLLQVVNNNPQLNGRLTLVYDNIATALQTIYEDWQDYEGGWNYLEEGNTNFTYLYADESTKKVTTNKAEYANYADVKKSIEDMIESASKNPVKYMVIYPELKDFKTNMNVSYSDQWLNTRSYGYYSGGTKWKDVFAVAVDTNYPIQDQFYQNSIEYQNNIPHMKAALYFMIFSSVLFLVTVVWLTLGAGRKPQDEELHLLKFDSWKTEIAAAVVIFVWVIGSYFFFVAGIDGIHILFDGITGLSSSYGAVESDTFIPSSYVPNVYMQTLSLGESVGAFAYGTFIFTCFFAGYLSLVRRIKAKSLWENSLLRSFGIFIGKILRDMKLTKKTAGLLILYFLFQLFVLWGGDFFLVILLLIADAVLFYYMVANVMEKNRLRKGIQEIAAGNMSYQIPIDGLHGENKKFALMINGIGTGLNKAVAEAMKNERLKTDLITNVSHDIKTPLTSILNYVGILRQTDPADPKVQDYLNILEEKAQRLKTLTEDVVEASKVSSGNISLEYMDLDLSEMIQQTQGELEEKFEARNLAIVTDLPAEPAVVHVDGRRMWRVLENIYGNAAKYAMPGTRVYATLKTDDTKVRFSLKNVSEHQLNIQADELTERFIRGDISRSTEGSGLGLSIAKSLTTMQGGTFDLYLDGDLFRVDITFPRVKAKGNAAGVTEELAEKSSSGVS